MARRGNRNAKPRKPAAAVKTGGAAPGAGAGDENRLVALDASASTGAAVGGGAPEIQMAVVETNAATEVAQPPAGPAGATAAEAAEGAGDTSPLNIGALENKTDGQEKGPDVQGAEDAAAQGSGDPDGQNASDPGADDAPGLAADHANDAEDGDGGASEAVVETAGIASLEEDYARSWRLDIAELARICAGGARIFANKGPVPDLDFEFSREEAAIMADFVRANPDAPVPAMFIHLGLQKRYPRTVPNRADEFVLSLFHAACKAAFKFEADQALDEQYALDAEAAAKTAGGWPGEQAFKPQEPAMSPTGFSPR